MAAAALDLRSLPERLPGTSAGMTGLSEPEVAHVADSLLLIEQSCTTTSVQVSACCGPVLLSGRAGPMLGLGSPAPASLQAAEHKLQLSTCMLMRLGCWIMSCGLTIAHAECMSVLPSLIGPWRRRLPATRGLIRHCPQAFVGTRSSLLLHIQLETAPHSQEAVGDLVPGSLLSRHVLGNVLPTSIVSLTGSEPGLACITP